MLYEIVLIILSIIIIIGVGLFLYKVRLSSRRTKDRSLAQMNAIIGMTELALRDDDKDSVRTHMPTVKQERCAVSSDADGAAGARADGGIFGIDGVDAAKGIALSGGSLNIYYETLEVFCEDALDRIPQLREILEELDMDLYITTVHALKSASANVGADGISAAAYALEMAGLQDDQAYINENNDAFLATLEKLVAEIAAALPSGGANGNAGGAGTGAYSGTCGEVADPGSALQLIAGLASLKTALEDMDIAAIDQSVSSLAKSALAADEEAFVRKISKLVLLGEYDEAITLIDGFLSQGVAK
jgi:HPt (histidine-containing phosphotransfer) domain-containing protein